jgi:PPOX class probable F420-dependent enzyme
MLESIRPFLETQQIAYLSTIDAQGYPHTVPVWFAVDGDDILFSSGRSRARVKFIQSNPKGSVTIGGQLSDSAGYLIKGNLTVEPDPSQGLHDPVLRRYLDEEGLRNFLSQMSGDERVLYRLEPTKVIKVH